MVTEGSGVIAPSAITYLKHSDGSYSLKKYEQAQDGAYFSTSIKQFCTMPVSGEKIKGLADSILQHNYDDILKLNTENLKAHLVSKRQIGISQRTNSRSIVPLT